MRKIAIVNMKGGVGKTTTALNMSAGFAARGCRVLLIDMDPQGNIGHALQAYSQNTIRELLLGEADIAFATIRGVRENLDVIVATTEAFSLERQLAGVTQRETILSRRLQGLSGYDVVILDTSPSMSLLTYNTLLYIQEAVIPVGMDLMAVIGARQTLNGIEEVRELWPERGLRIAAILPTFVSSFTKATRATIAALETDSAMRQFLYARGIRQCLDLTYAAAAHQTIWEYAPRSRAREDFDAFLDFLERNNRQTQFVDAAYA
jgi:chromosome partitioning protein